MRAGRRDIRRRRRRGVIASAAGLTGTGSHVTSRRPRRVDVSVVDVAVDEAEYSAGGDQHQENQQADIHRRYVCRSVQDHCACATNASFRLVRPSLCHTLTTRRLGFVGAEVSYDQLFLIH